MRKNATAVKKKTDGINRQELLSVLAKMRPGLATKDVVEQATALVFKDGFVWSFNDEIAISHPLPDKVEIDGVAVPAEPLIKYLEKATAETMTMTIIDKEGTHELRLNCGKHTAGIGLQEIKLAVEDIPLPDDKEWCGLHKDFLEGAALARLSCTADMSTPVLSCVCWTGKDLIGCDNFQLTKVSLAKAKAFLENVLLPAMALRTLKDYAPNAYAIKEGWAHFINDDDVLYSFRTVSGKYPDVSPLLKISGKEVKLPDGLTAALDRAGVFSKAEFQQDEQVTLEADGLGTLVVEARGLVGWSKDALTMPKETPPFVLAVNPAVLAKSLTLGTTVTVSENALAITGTNFIHVVCLT